MRRRNGPVQQWVDSIPSPTNTSTPRLSIKQQEHTSGGPNIPVTSTEPKDIPLSKTNYTRPPSMTVSAPINVPSSPAINTIGIPSSLPYNRLARDPSVQSDSSHCSSVESLLELRRADPEAILLGLGFGGCSNSPQESGPLSRIPKRFLQPSKLKGIAITDFVKQQQETSESFDSVSLGYRGLTGSPYVAPSEIVQKIMERLREHESHEGDTSGYNSHDHSSTFQQSNKFSVLSPDSRQFLEQPRSKSPDMRNKRMIIGQKSFAFGCDGDLIEIDSSVRKVELNDDSINCQDIEDTKADDLTISPEPNTTPEGIFNMKTEKRLSKQLSFDETEWSESENDPYVQEPDKQSPEVTSNYEEMPTNAEDNDICTNIRMQNTVSTVRTQCNRPDYSNLSKDSRVSSTVNITENISSNQQQIKETIEHVTAKNDICRSSLPKLFKRKNLKRQSRICESDSLCDENDPLKTIVNTVPCSSTQVSSSITPLTNELQSDDLSKNLACTSQINSSNSVFETTNESTTELDFKDRCNRNDGICCREEKLGQICKHDKDFKDCCCHEDDTKCWKKMQKIIEENKKLEDMVAKSRREMAEIRDMLSSVLSVRMEPGF